MTLLLHHARGGTRRALELVSLAVAAFLVGYFGWYACDMTITSYRLNDVSQGLVAVPLWIPQAGMGLGLGTLFVATGHDFVAALRGPKTPYDTPRARKTAAVPGFER